MRYSVNKKRKKKKRPFAINITRITSAKSQYLIRVVRRFGSLLSFCFMQRCVVVTSVLDGATSTAEIVLAMWQILQVGAVVGRTWIGKRRMLTDSFDRRPRGKGGQIKVVSKTSRAYDVYHFAN